MVRTDPRAFTTLQAVSHVAAGNDGEQDFKGYHHKYVEALVDPMHDNYFAHSRYFHSIRDKKTRRELAGIRIEYALPAGMLDEQEAGSFTRDYIARVFSIGNPRSPTLWTSATPPDVRLTMGSNNAGFVSLEAGLKYLQEYPDKTVWVMGWDAPSRPKDTQINENMVLLVLAGPHYKTERAALAWIGYPAARNAQDFELARDKPPRAVQAWQAVFAEAAHHGGTTGENIGFVIHDANRSLPDSSERIGQLAQALTLEVPEFDFLPQTFNTPALLGEMGAGTALTNVALAIGHAHHMGKPVLVAGTSDSSRLTGVLVLPPATVRPIDHDKPWFRARGEAYAYLPWWGLRHDEDINMQGFSR